jgi:hypothetical protein
MYTSEINLGQMYQRNHLKSTESADGHTFFILPNAAESTISLRLGRYPTRATNASAAN